MNCLITSIGTYAAETVISSLRKYPVTKIIGCDIYPYNWLPAAPAVDIFYQVSIVYDNNDYLKKLIEIIVKEKIDFVLPLIDPEVDLLSEFRNDIEKYNSRICISNNKAVSICRDKFLFYNFLKNDGRVNLVPTFDAFSFSLNCCKLPIIAKPRNGRSSKGIIIFDTEEEVRFKQSKLQNYIFQPLFKGDIFTVDLVRDNKNNKSVAVSRKELIRTINGTGMCVEVSPNKELNALAQYIGERLDINGCINMEFIFYDNKYYLMDINPRFSTGVSFSILAGYDMVINHLNCFTGKEIQGPITYKKMTIVKKITDVITKIEDGKT